MRGSLPAAAIVDRAIASSSPVFSIALARPKLAAISKSDSHSMLRRASLDEMHPKPTTTAAPTKAAATIGTSSRVAASTMPASTVHAIQAWSCRGGVEPLTSLTR